MKCTLAAAICLVAIPVCVRSQEFRGTSFLRSHRVDGFLIAVAPVDNVKGAQDCVRHSIRSGHQEIAIITGSLALEIGRQRLKGYEAAFKEAKMKVRRSLIYEGDFREQAGYRLGKEILIQRRRPTALFVCNGVMTLGVLQALDETGVRCPGDIAIATFDDLPFGRAFHPKLTCVAQPAYELGFKGATLLIDRIEGKLARGFVEVQLASELRIRESTGGV